MRSIFLLPVLFILMGCAQESDPEVIDVTPVEYQLIAHTGIDSLPTAEVTMTFDGVKFSGKGPVNRYFGQITEGKISSPIGSTMMAGPDALMKYEQQFFTALENSAIQGIGLDTLRVFKDDEVQMVFVKSEG